MTELSTRERQVVAAIAEGLTNKEIGVRLGIGIRTIETHRENAMQKLDAHGIAKLTHYAIAHGLVPLADPTLLTSEMAS